MTERVHLARCDHCGRKIAWSRDRRQWLALAPITDIPGRQIQRRMRCPSAPKGIFHDPRANLLDRMMSKRFGPDWRLPITERINA